MWAYESVFYQIYPLGFTGVPFENDGILRHGILKVVDWIPHIQKLGCNAVYFSPVFESDTHGYNTRDYRLIDKRLGTNEDFGKVTKALHEAGIKVVLDGVFNHVGRGHFAFQDLLEHGANSRYFHWFNVNLQWDSPYQDGLWYEGWEGNYDLVKLNLNHPEVVEYLLESLRFWVDQWDIDGVRLDVAYCLEESFMIKLRTFTDSLKTDFFLLGEMVHGDYNRLVKDNMLHSATNYECYKGIYSSLNSYNLFEIVHSLLRQFGSENWTLYRGKHLLSFVDNHDVSRIASALEHPEHLPLAFALEFGIPGIPQIYYGSEWGEKAAKSQGDPALRPAFEHPMENELTEYIARLVQVKKNSHGLNYGEFASLVLTNRQCVFARSTEQETIYVAINCDSQEYTVHLNLETSQLRDLLEGVDYDISDGFTMKGNQAYFLK